MRDPDEGHPGAVRQSDGRAAAADSRCRHNMVDGSGILAREADRIAMRLIEADHSILTPDPAILEQSSPGSGHEQIVAGPAIESIVPAAAINRVVRPGAD